MDFRLSDKCQGEKMNSNIPQSTTEPTSISKLPPIQAVKPQYGGVLRIATNYVISSTMGVPGRQNLGALFMDAITDRFLGVDDAGQMVPHLIESWEFSKDGLQVTLHLRKSVKFHDGSDFNAEAARWNLLKAREFKGTLNGIVSIDVVDEHTILVHLKSFDNIFLSYLAWSSGFVHSPTAYKTCGEEYAMVHPVGTGPFKFVSYKQDVNLVVERFDGYWQEGKPYVDKMEMIYVPDLAKAVDMLRNGEVNVVLNINGASAAALKAEGYTVTERPWTMKELLPDSLNYDSIFADKRVRQALEYAIDRPALVKTLGHGYFPLTQLATRDVYGFNQEIEGRPYNPDKAKQLLAEAGYPDGFKTKIIGGDGTDLRQVFTEIQKYLAAVGIKADIEIADAALWKAYKANKPWHNTLIYRSFAADPTFSASLIDLHSKKEYGQTSVLRNFDHLIDAVLQARDRETMVKAAQRVVKHIYDEAIVVPILLDSSIVATSSKVHGHGFFGDHIAHWTPWNAWIEH
jgi:peptide/nickel transport system substrate-binding protein